MRASRIAMLVVLSASILHAVTLQQEDFNRPQQGVITTGQSITPAGVQAILDGRTYGVAFGAAGEAWALVNKSDESHLYRLSWTNNRIVQHVKMPDGPGTQALQFDSSSGAVFFGVTRTTDVAGGPGTRVRLMRLSPGASRATAVSETLGRNQVGAIALARKPNLSGARLGVVPLTYNNQIAIVDVNSGRLKGKLPTGIAPFAVAINAGGTVAYASNWGGRLARAGERTLNSGNLLEADLTDKPLDRVVVDKSGMAATGSVTRFDLTSMNVTDTIEVGLHPTALAWDEPHARLYVANSNSDSVSVINTRTQRVVATLAIQPFQTKAPGIAPTALAVDPAHDRLYVACGGINAIAVFDTSRNIALGLIPTAWYPCALSLSQDGRRLAVGAMLGVGSGWEMSAALARIFQKRFNLELPNPSRRYVHAYRGTVNIVEIPDATQLSAYTIAVGHNNHLALKSAAASNDLAPREQAAPVAIPARVGEPSFIKHVVYIIKENRTYDQIFGDLGKGNGDPSLALWGAEVAPNHRRLVDQFVVLDNFYATGGDSGDGHQWATQANETEYTLWPGYGGRSYPYAGDDPIAVARGGFIWDAALEKKLSVRIFGEYVGHGFPERVTREQLKALKEAREAPAAEEVKRNIAAWRAGVDFSVRYHNVAPNDALNAIMAHNYPAWGIEKIPDVVRAQVFQTHVKQWEREGKMPNLVIVHLPSDHTEGTAPGRPTPRASIADNDWALGLIVETLSHSTFWTTMAIFVVEDDAQGGVDHVDGHRTVAMAISPYTRRGSIDSTFYAQQSMLKTIELILGLPAMSIFDLTATPMRASFQDTPELTQYVAVEPKQPLDEINPPLRSLQGAARRGALESMEMRFDVVDAAPSDRLNRILWHDARGWNTPYPRSPAAVFSPFSVNLDDEDRSK